VKLSARGGRDRGIWLLNLALLVVMTLCVLSGVLISQVALYQLGISVHPGPFWTNIHDTTSKLTLILASVHVAVRWRWIASVARRLLGPRRLGASRRPGGSRRSR
jgi:cytochrome b